MRLVITNFRSIRNLQLEVDPSSRVTLIKGKSGAGKSTIFHALSWMLYNKPLSVDPRDRSLKKSDGGTVVRFEHGSMAIERRKSPKRLSVWITSTSLDGTAVVAEHVDDEAQKWIESRWGLFEVWETCCHLAQKKSHVFADGTASEKLSLITSLVFGDLDPEAEIERVASACTELKRTLDNHQQQLARAKADLEARYAGDAFEEPQSEIDIDDCTSAAVQTKSELASLKDEHRQHALRLAQIRDLMSRNKKIQTVLDSLDLTNTSDADLCGLESELINLKTAESALSSNEALVTKKRRAEDELRPLACVNTALADMSVEQVSQQQQQYLAGLQVRRQFGLANEAGAIQSRMDVLQQELSNETGAKFTRTFVVSWIDYLKRKDVLDKAIPEELRVVLSSPDRSRDEIEARTLHVRRLEDSLRVMPCPACATPLSLNESGSELVVSEQNIASLTVHRSATEKDNSVHAMIEQQKQLVHQLVTLSKQVQQVEMLRKTATRTLFTSAVSEYLQCSSPEDFDLEESRRILADLPTSEQLAQWKKELEVLRRTPEVDRPLVDVETVRKAQRKRELLQRVEDLKEVSIDDLESTGDLPLAARRRLLQEQILKMSEDLRYRHAARQRHRSLSDDMKTNSTRIATMLDGSANVESVEEDITHFERSISDKEQEVCRLESRLAALKRGREHMRDRLSLESLETKEREILRLFETHTELLHTARRIHAETLQDAFDSINASIADVLTNVFDELVDVQLTMFKDLKKGGQQTCVNLNVQYRNAQFDGIQGLSGGEADRVSIALAIACSKLHSFPLLLLDESISTIDSEAKLSVIRALRSTGKNCFVVLHDAVEGYFDHVFEMRSVE